MGSHELEPTHQIPVNGTQSTDVLAMSKTLIWADRGNSDCASARPTMFVRLSTHLFETSYVQAKMLMRFPMMSHRATWLFDVVAVYVLTYILVPAGRPLASSGLQLAV